MNVLSKELERLLQNEADEEEYQKDRTRFLKHYYQLRQKKIKGCLTGCRWKAEEKSISTY